ncbi:MAG: helix-turn-helix domain-containing protein [Clostridia bacterium]|nr:helix-turn-helix domain-containing protein [Clostridia bacterium]
MKSTDTKERILSEALKLFAQKGYEAVGVTEIADAVGIKAPSLYKHYKSKRDIFDSIINCVNEMDLERAKDFQMPEGTIEQMRDSYKNVSFEKISAFTKSIFLYWTQEEFSCCFRKLLTLEQYKSKEMGELYRQYISGGPLKYMADIFSSMTESAEEAMQSALLFYGPIYLLYNIYDDTSDIAFVMTLLEKHIENFSKNFNENRLRGEKI